MSMAVSNSSPFSSLLESVFKKEDYIAKTPQVKQDTLTYLIVLKQPQEIIDRYIDKLFKEKSPKIEAVVTSYQLSPLCVAVIMGRLGVVKKLLLAGANPNKQDSFGWTPVVHSALVADEIAQELFKAGGLREHRTISGGVNYDLLIDVVGKNESIDGLKRLTLEVKGQRIENPSKEDVEGFMGLDRYRDNPFYHLQHLRNLWDKTRDHERVVPTNEMYILEALKGRTPKLLLKNDPQLGLAESSMNRGVWADEKITRGQFVTTYSGESIEESQYSLLERLTKKVPHKPYLFERIDAQDVGNEGRMINDGLPNLFFLSYGFQTYFFASRDIEKGEELLWNYGITEHLLKFGPYALKDKERLHQTVKDNIDEWEEKFNAAHMVISSPKSSDARIHKAIITMCGAYSHMKYLVDTPAALVDLLVRETISIDQVNRLFKVKFVQDEAKVNEVSHFLRMKMMEFLNYYHQIMKVLKDGPAKEAVKEAILEQEGKLEVFNWLTFIRYVTNIVHLNKEDQVIELLTKYHESLLQKAKQYTFTNFDETCPLTFNIH
jgi:hypothetical protein